MVDNMGLLGMATAFGFCATMIAWVALWGVSKVIQMFKSITKM